MAKESFPRCITPPGVIRYSWLDKPDLKTPTSPYGDGKFKATLLLDRKADLKALKDAVIAAARMRWGPGVDLTKLQKPFGDGDAKAEKHPDFAGKIVVTAKTQYPPDCVGTARGEAGRMLPLGPTETIWAGDTARLSLEAYPYENTKDVIVVGPDGKERTEKRLIMGVTFQLRAVQLVAKGERVGGSGGAKDFDDSSDEYVVTGAEAETASAGAGVSREVVKGARPAAAAKAEDFDLF